MNFIIRKPWHPSQLQLTPWEVFRDRREHRREFLRSVGYGLMAAGLGAAGSGCSRPSEDEVIEAGRVVSLPEKALGIYPAQRNTRFEYGRTETNQRDALEYCNFYEFSGGKSVWQHVGSFQPTPWSVEVGGMCAQPQTFDLDDLSRLFDYEERAYRHRCVETWAMCVPWTGFPLRDLLKHVEPQPSAKFVAFESFDRPQEAQHMRSASQYPWPYREGLTLEEATNELAFVATGLYGEPLPKQNGAPIRLVLPWKYGFKSIKSVVKVTLTDKQPETFWNTLIPKEYGFEANVNPDVSHPRWSQRTEWMLGNRQRYETVIYNGYGEYVAKLYS